MKFIVELWLDGYETEDEMKKACVDFIDDQLNFSGSSVTIENYDDLKAKYQKAVSALSAIEDGKVYSPDRLYSRHGTTIEIQNIARLCRAELGEKE